MDLPLTTRLDLSQLGRVQVVVSGTRARSLLPTRESDRRVLCNVVKCALDKFGAH